MRIVETSSTGLRSPPVGPGTVGTRAIPRTAGPPPWPADRQPGPALPHAGPAFSSSSRRGGPTTGTRQNVPPTTPAIYGNFAKAAAREYPGVHLWMIWGEPDRTPNFSLTQAVPPGANLDAGQQAAPHRLRPPGGFRLRLAEGGQPAKSCHRGVDFLGWEHRRAAVDQNLRLPNGRPPRMDMYAHNPFSVKNPNFSDPPSPFGETQFSDLPELAGWIDRYLHRGMKIFLSEFTIPTKPDLEFFVLRRSQGGRQLGHERSLPGPTVAPHLRHGLDPRLRRSAHQLRGAAHGAGSTQARHSSPSSTGRAGGAGRRGDASAAFADQRRVRVTPRVIFPGGLLGMIVSVAPIWLSVMLEQRQRQAAELGAERVVAAPPGGRLTAWPRS